ncbi:MULTISPECIES: Rieske 2Fe-2S domain-containing protein [Rhodococcus]|jgi:phenylpropionate dioxygenase-like ring-hydroxylating dioxygenase large terminal subunit|nr:MULTISPECIES: aromatic ring-hydroxylating dioxygenase subunit alpha [Rhodococcus]ETT23765.1 3-phenylpropanoate dioxygenase [Rhodococcus rhodochrous ATCC 21198]AKE91648.1 Rieske (2Fe-2S) protein [Rhodococcus aetherivorans]ANZ23513.1 Rieske (2Fe-2S) protein [Rhodococcus sp. WB1]KDE10705.1 Rieske (2Fe-2S) protein [Rhodococcus aetherivorans]MBC2589504.1 aromatic ring-hydroxylating dioxygenase subunit alpha [Rhodococcus aetherivorans]
MTTTEEPTARTYADLVANDRVAGRLYTDPDIFQEEMKKIFYKTWVWVAHESEIPEAGSFKTTQVGDQPVIVTRDRKGNFNTLLNRCRHRGATVCDQRSGKANGFTCPYHNWSYALDGRLRGIPYPDGYEGVVDKKDFPLQTLRTESYLGMIWATFDQDAEPLEDFLGDAKIWMERFFKQSNGFPTKVLGVHKFRFKGNWKIQLENTTDGYHFPMVHKSWMASVDAETADMMSFMDDPAAETHALGNGHSVAIMAAAHADLDVDDGTEEIQPRFQHLVDELAAAGESPERIRRYMRSMHGCGFNLNTFPNVAMSSSFFRVLIPLSVDETEIWHMALGMDGGPESVNRERLRIHEHFQGPFGFGSPDDAEGWIRVQIGAGGNPNMPILVNRGEGREYTTEEGWPTSHVTDETGMREAYAMWKKMMSND